MGSQVSQVERSGSEVQRFGNIGAVSLLKKTGIIRKPNNAGTSTQTVAENVADSEPLAQGEASESVSVMNCGCAAIRLLFQT